jgi:hypothetical protein
VSEHRFETSEVIDSTITLVLAFETVLQYLSHLEFVEIRALHISVAVFLSEHAFEPVLAGKGSRNAYRCDFLFLLSYVFFEAIILTLFLSGCPEFLLYFLKKLNLFLSRAASL